MNIPCKRCHKSINSPNELNADYIIDGNKTAIICPNCYQDTDIVIWGIDKLVEVKRYREIVNNPLGNIIKKLFVNPIKRLIR